MNPCEDSVITKIKGIPCVYLSLEVAKEVEDKKRLKSENKQSEEDVQSKVKVVGD